MLINCDCSVNSDTDNAIYKAKVRRAIKPHKCCECGEVIHPGEQYERVDALTDGQWWGCNTCLGCVRVRNHYCSGGWLHYGLAEQLYDCLGFDYRTVPEAEDEG